MSRLRHLPPMVARLPSTLRVAPKVADSLYVSREWRKLVAEIKAERGAWCQQCGSRHRVAGDHVVEVKDGGAALDRGNVRLLCQACHNAKTARERARRALR